LQNKIAIIHYQSATSLPKKQNKTNNDLVVILKGL